MPPYGPRKYDPLARYLAEQRGDWVTLTFAEVAAILGVTLPPSAGTGHFWVNATRNSPQARAWRRAGWRVARVQLHSGTPTVTFVRAPR
jgi:hypothetical protein